VFSWKWNI